jgi:hypothetical protein
LNFGIITIGGEEFMYKIKMPFSYELQPGESLFIQFEEPIQLRSNQTLAMEVSPDILAHHVSVVGVSRHGVLIVNYGKLPRSLSEGEVLGELSVITKSRSTKKK